MYSFLLAIIVVVIATIKKGRLVFARPPARSLRNHLRHEPVRAQLAVLDASDERLLIVGVGLESCREFRRGLGRFGRERGEKRHVCSGRRGGSRRRRGHGRGV